MQIKLMIYVERNCDNCEQAYNLAHLIGERMPQVQVLLIDLLDPQVERPPQVFAVPTYVLNGETISLGNPAEETLLARLEGMAG